MIFTTHQQRRELESLAAKQLAAHQLSKLNRLLKAILPQNRFYADKLAHLSAADLQDPDGPLRSHDQLAELPFTFKEELISQTDSHHLTANLTFPSQQYTRYHQTSGTRGRPLAVLDTAEDWAWWVDCWQFVLDVAELEQGDTVFLAFSFGPFIGFWSAFDAAAARGCLVVPGGGMSTLARLDLMRTTDAVALFCTPSYALHLAEVAAENQIDVAELDVRVLVLAGEPGGSIPAVRERIESIWQARVVDHAGATEVGPWGYGNAAGDGLFVNEHEFIAEFLSVETGTAASEGELSELVLTNLGRVGSPVIRYRTGDLVRPSWQHAGDNRFVFLPGGVLSRSDDMMVIRGVNVFPSSVEQILRSFPELIEYRMTVRRQGEMDQIVVEIEDRLSQPDRVATELRLRLGLKVEVQAVPLGSLPRVEGKGKRFVDERCPTNGNH
ncbi:MAG: phenylacetate--CoA ligase family protein [Planctomycetota bacterium]|nr:MAG: phenylacetate--CoA ligase family protein [Planctomycetota bacterium]